MNITTLSKIILNKQNVLCIGLDSDISKIPGHLNNDQFLFNKKIIDATKDFCVAYKINTAFYESEGIQGWQALKNTLDYIPKSHFVIADAKRGDIGNTAQHYAKTFFETLNFDALTVSPYMGLDTLKPFLNYEDKVTIVLGLTSNPGSEDFQKLLVHNPQNTALLKLPLYQFLIKQVSEIGTKNNLMFVVGATNPNELESIRTIVPNHFLLVPGIGTQGGDLQKTVEIGLNSDGGLLINVSRDIIFQSNAENFADVAALKAMEYCNLIKKYWHLPSSK